MDAPPVCEPHHNFFVALLTFGLCCGLIISYLPQHFRIINKGSSEGFSPWFLLLGCTSSAAGMVNMITLQWGLIKCCRVFTFGSCLEVTAGVIQVGLQWFMFNFILVLYIIYFPPHLKFVSVQVEAHDTRSSVVLKAPVKTSLWQLSLLLSGAVLLHLIFIAATTVVLLSLEPIQSTKDDISAWATFLGVTSAILAAIQYAPQLLHTYRMKLVGALSIPMMCIQSPGAVLMVTSIALREGTDWTSWITFAVAGMMQGSLLIMCIMWKFRQQRLGIDDFGNPIGTESSAVNQGVDPVPGLVPEDHDPAVVQQALSQALESAVASDVRDRGGRSIEEPLANEQTPLLPGKETSEESWWTRLRKNTAHPPTLMASLIAILDLKGKPLIQRSYRDDVPPSYVERFLPIILDLEEENQQVTPCFSRDGINYMHIRHSNLYLLALSKRNSNAAETILFLHRLTQVLVEYFKELEEESIRDNFVIIYELMDEMMDFGYPQTTESKILQEYITQESHKLEIQVRPPPAVTNAVSWRTEGIRYRKNEVFLDVIESVNLLVNANGNVVRSEILGAVKMKCYLSGMPELRLGLNDKVMFESTGRTARGKAIEMEDIKFHQCVRLSRFENDRTISFIPPDGEFELMSYRLSTPVKPLIWVEAAVESHRGSRVEYMVKVIAQFKRRSTANNVEIYVPVPDDADSPKFRASTGTVQYAPDKSAFVWKIKQLGGGREFLMRAHFGLPSVKNEQDVEKRAPITVKFEIPYFTVSGIQVRYLKIVEKSGYQALPWVRYITQNGDDYSLRTALEKGSAPIRPM